jgi:hypothetical protein
MQKILEMKAANARGRSTPAPPLPLGEETLDLTLLPPENFRYPLLLLLSPWGRRPWTLPFFRQSTVLQVSVPAPPPLL